MLARKGAAWKPQLSQGQWRRIGPPGGAIGPGQGFALIEFSNEAQREAAMTALQGLHALLSDRFSLDDVSATRLARVVHI